MAILDILTFPDPRLKIVSKDVEVFDAELKQLCDDMLETMYDAPGVGLAAAQVNVHKNIFVIDIDYEATDDEPPILKNQNPQIFINPKFLEMNGETVTQEGCLSVPDIYENVKRAEHIKIEYCDMNGEKHTLETDGFLAIAIQHENDHLLGKLFLDRLSFLKSKTIRKKILKAQKQS